MRALAGFGGVARRFQYRGERDGVTFIDDYAHLPSEVGGRDRRPRARGRGGGSIVVFQPHRYTRTASIGRDFADAFTAADAVVLTDVYPAGETPIPGVSGRVDPARGARHASRAAGRVLPRAADLLGVPGAVSRARATSC